MEDVKIQRLIGLSGLYPVREISNLKPNFDETGLLSC